MSRSVGRHEEGLTAIATPTASPVRRRMEVIAGMAAKEGYCVKCKTKREIKDAQEITMKNGRPATQGLCPSCGTKIFKIGK